MLSAALEAEVESYLAQHADALDKSGRRLVVRNGHCPERAIQTGLGSLDVSRTEAAMAAPGGSSYARASSMVPDGARKTLDRERFRQNEHLHGLR